MHLIRTPAFYLKGFGSYSLCALRYLKNWIPFLWDWMRLKRGLPPQTNLLILRNGHKLYLHAGSRLLHYVFWEIFGKGLYEDVRYPLGKNDVIVDVGANVGIFAVKAAMAATAGRVYALEPFPPHFELLKKNTAALPNVSIFCEGLSDRQTTLSFYYTQQDEPNYTSMFAPEKGAALKTEIEVLTLKKFFQREKITKVALMKMDCEGAEYDVILKEDPSVFQSIDRIVLEWHRLTPAHDPFRLVSRLVEMGYRVKAEIDEHAQTGYLFAKRK